MITRRSLVAAGLVLATGTVANAFEFHAYTEAAADAAIKSGKPVVIHVFAPWCLQCQAQAAILARLSSDPQLDRIAFFKVSYDDQKDVVAALGCPRSTLIGYKGGKEVARMSWGTSQADVAKILQAVS